MSKYLIQNGKTKKYITPEVAETAAQYKVFIRQKLFETVECKVSLDEYIDLWLESGKWAERGKGYGAYTLYPDRNANPVTAADCKILQWSKEVIWRKPNQEEMRRAQNREVKAAIRAEKAKLKSIKQAEIAPRKAEQEDKLRLRVIATLKEKGLPIPADLLRPENEPIPKKERKPKKTPKYYTKSAQQAIRQSMKDLAKEYRYRSAKQETIEEAVQNFYDNSTNPINAKILELAKQPRTNYRSHNLVTLGVRKIALS